MAKIILFKNRKKNLSVVNEADDNAAVQQQIERLRNEIQMENVKYQNKLMVLQRQYNALITNKTKLLDSLLKKAGTDAVTTTTTAATQTAAATATGDQTKNANAGVAASPGTVTK